jgi:hypothetical protein
MRLVEGRNPAQEDVILAVKHHTQVGSLRVVADARALVSRSGTALAAEVAGRLGVTAALSGALAHLYRRRPVHDPGRVLVDLATMLIDGGECVSDLGVLADQPDLFGQIASHSTASRWAAGLRGSCWTSTATWSRRIPRTGRGGPSQARLRVSSAGLLAGRHRRAAGDAVAARQRGRQHRRRPCDGS